VLQVSAAPHHILMTADAVGGVWTYALDLAAGLTAHGTRTTLVLLGPGLDASRRAQAESVPDLVLVESGLPLDWLAGSAEAVIETGRAVADLAVRHRVDSVHLNSPALAAAPGFDLPVVGACHSCLATWWDAVKGGAQPVDFAWHTALLARGYAACAELVAPSNAFSLATRRRYGLLRAPRVVHNGRPAGAVAEVAERIVLTAGRLWDEGKDLATLDRAAALLDMPVFAAGPVEGPNGAAVRLPSLSLLGTLNEAGVAGWLARGPVFVSTARYEPFGLAVLEAAQAGCALVLSDIPTFRELWDGAARFVKPGDAEGFAGAIAEVSQNREQRSSLGVAARRRGEGLTASAMVGGIAAIHAGLVNRTTSRGRSVAA
jgi:glycosyltransferase involved in cell wall biosynthesis